MRWLLPLLLSCSPAKAPVAAVQQHPRVVVISIDGLRWDYLTSAAKIPTLRALADRGAHGALKSIWPTVTYPAHTTLVTGVRPAKHGIYNNLPFDPLGQNFDGWYWYARDIKVPTLWDVARQRGWKTANVYWPVTVGAKFDWSFPQIWRARNEEDDKLMWSLSTPGLAEEVSAKYGRIPGERRDDTARAEGAEYILRVKKPELSFVYLTDLDTVQHGWGPHTPKAFETLEAIDKDVERIMAAAGPATIVIVSDHGFLPVTQIVKPNVLLRSAGLIDVSNGRVTGYRAAAWKAGGSCAIMVKDPAALPIVKGMFANVAGVARVHESVEGGFPGAALVLEAADGFMFSPGVEGPLTEPTSERGAHGYSPDRKEMQATVIFAGDGIKPQDLGVVEMIDIAPTIAKIMGIPFASDGQPRPLGSGY